MSAEDRIENPIDELRAVEAAEQRAVDDPRAQAHIPEILVQSPASVGLLFAEADRRSDTTALQALHVALGVAAGSAVMLLRDQAGAQDTRGGWTPSGKPRNPRMLAEPLCTLHHYADDRSGFPFLHAHLTIAPRQRYRGGGGRQVIEPTSVEMCSGSAQAAFTEAMREQLGRLGFTTVDVPPSVTVTEWEIDALADRAAEFPIGMPPCRPITDGQPQIVPAAESAKRDLRTYGVA